MNTESEIVRNCYAQNAVYYNLERDKLKSLPYLQMLNALLSPNSQILDLGCGTGNPVDSFFIEHGHKVHGVDLTEAMIELARENVPDATFEVKDILELYPGQFQAHAVVSFYTIFHVLRTKHKQVFSLINSFLPLGGYTLLTLGGKEKEKTGEYHNQMLYWSQYDAEINAGLLADAGFDLLMNVVEKGGSSGTAGIHQIVLAQKIRDIS